MVTEPINAQGWYYAEICPYCGASHAGACTRVEEVEYYPDGALKRVKLRPAEPVEGITTTTADELGHECGKDCPQTTWTSEGANSTHGY